MKRLKKKLLEIRVRNVCNDIRRKLSARGVGRNYQRFRDCNSTWLQRKIMFAGLEKKKVPGRPSKNFAEAHDRTQRRKIEPLRKQATGKELALAAEMNPREEGHNDAAKVINAVAQKSTNNGSDVRAQLCKGENTEPIRHYTANEALALKLQLGLGKNKYKFLRMGMVARGLPEMYPSHEKIEKAEQECLPSHITVSEHGAEIRLQALVDHTAKRLIVSLEKEIVDFVRLKKKEKDTAFSVEYFKRMEAEVSGLTPSVVPLSSIQVQVHHNLIASMVDGKAHWRLQGSGAATGKVCSALADTSSAACHVCGARPVEMNHLSTVLKKDINKNTFQFGLSPLHARI
ncbi:Cytochrome c1, heme protein, mitochondrial, partial [Frankliniella fusca]